MAGKHAGEPANENSRAIDQQARGEELAEEFDIQWAISTARAETKRDNGTYPYDLDRHVQ